MDVLDNEEDPFSNPPLKPQLPVNNTSLHQKANPNQQQVNNNHQNGNSLQAPKNSQNQIHSQK